MVPTNGCTAFELTKQEFESLLCPHIGSDITVEDFTTEALTQPGENYGSTILAAELTIQKDKKKIKLPLVVKLVPPSEFLRNAFDIQVTFNKEMHAYKLVSPEYEKLQKENGISREEFLDVFPKFYGARTNRKGDSNEKADDTAVIILENLKLSGYDTGDRLKGLNLNHMKLGVSHLARFHAISVALKILKPDLFKRTVLKACENCILGGIADDNIVEKWVTSTLDDVKCIPECLPYLCRVETVLREYMKEKQSRTPTSPNEPFATFVHNDFWVNNMLFKYGTSDDTEHCSDFENPTNIKFVDFQTTCYASPIIDLIFFIYSSATDNVIENYRDTLLNLYHRVFLNCLSKFVCNTDSFSFEHFQDELNFYAPKEFPHILVMIKFISADTSKVPDLSNCDAAVMLQNNFGGKIYEKRVKLVLLDFVQRGWL